MSCYSLLAIERKKYIRQALTNPATIITIIKSKISYVARSFNSSSLTIKSIVISSYSESST